MWKICGNPALVDDHSLSPADECVEETISSGRQRVNLREATPWGSWNMVVIKFIADLFFFVFLFFNMFEFLGLRIVIQWLMVCGRTRSDWFYIVLSCIVMLVMFVSLTVSIPHHSVLPPPPLPPLKCLTFWLGRVGGWVCWWRNLLSNSGTKICSVLSCNSAIDTKCQFKVKCVHVYMLNINTNTVIANAN